MAPGLRPWISRGAWSVVDRGLSAGSNFVLTVLLARWLDPEGFGAFTVVYAAFLLLGSLHTGVLTEPMLVFGPGRFRSRLDEYLRVLLRGHALFCLVSALITALAGVVAALAGSAVLARALLALAVAQPFILLLWLLRRASYTRFNVRLSATGEIAYTVVMLAGMWLLHRGGLLSAHSGLLLMSASGLAGSIWILVGMRLNPLAAVSASMIAPTLKQHWSYGTWAAATGVLGWVLGGLSYVLVPIWSDLDASGAWKALMTLIMPAINVYAAITILLLPVLARAREDGQLFRISSIALLATAGGTSIYWAALALWGRPIMAWLYDGQYMEYAYLLWLIGVLPLMGGVVAVLRTGLKALERPNDVFWANLGSAVVVVTAGVWVIAQYGVLGAALSHILAAVVEVGLMAYFFFKIRGKQAVAQPSVLQPLHPPVVDEIRHGHQA
jgi:O-antigen/teichoic acid export membrane protein